MLNADIISFALASGRNLLFADEAGALLKAAGIPVTPCLAAAAEDEAVHAAKEIGFPVVLKVRSQAVVHKTEAGASAWGWRMRGRCGSLTGRLWRRPVCLTGGRR